MMDIRKPLILRPRFKLLAGPPVETRHQDATRLQPLQDYENRGRITTCGSLTHSSSRSWFLQEAVCAQVLGYDDLDFSASGGSSSGSGGVADSGSADVLNDASLGGSAGAAGSAGGGGSRCRRQFRCWQLR